MKFVFEAYDQSGKRLADTIEANDKADATERLRRKGLYVTDLKGEGQGPASNSSAPSGAIRGKTPRNLGKHLSVFSREMSVLVSTGTPLVEALMALERQAKGDIWKGVLHQVRCRVEEGKPLSEAMGEHPRVFDAVSRSLVAAGESSGKLDVMLARLASMTRRQAQTRGNIHGAMLYPILLMCVAVAVTTLMIVFVLPRFSGLFETLDTELPGTTKFLMLISGLVRGYWWGILPGLIVGIGGGVYWLRTPGGKGFRDDIMLKVPQFGPIVQAFSTARIARILGVLLEAHVPMMESLALTSQAMSNRNYTALVDTASEAVTRGESISASFSQSDLVSGSVCEAIHNGEQTGRLGEVLVSVADYLDEENETVIKSLSSLIEPLIMLGLGLVVAFVAISMFLPLFDLTAAAGSG